MWVGQSAAVADLSAVAAADLSAVAADLSAAVAADSSVWEADPVCRWAMAAAYPSE